MKNKTLENNKFDNVLTLVANLLQRLESAEKTIFNLEEVYMDTIRFGIKFNEK